MTFGCQQVNSSHAMSSDYRILLPLIESKARYVSGRLLSCTRAGLIPLRCCGVLRWVIAALRVLFSRRTVLTEFQWLFSFSYSVGILVFFSFILVSYFRTYYNFFNLHVALSIRYLYLLVRDPCYSVRVRDQRMHIRLVVVILVVY